MNTYLAYEGPHERLPEPIIAPFRDPHLLPHDLGRRHRPPWPRRWHGERYPGGPTTIRSIRRGGTRPSTISGARHHPPRRRPLEHLQPKCPLHTARRGRHHPIGLRPRSGPTPIPTTIVVASAIIVLVVRVEDEGVSSPEARGRTTRGEEDLVRGLAYVIAVYALELAKGPDEVGVGVVVVGAGGEEGAA